MPYDSLLISRDDILHRDSISLDTSAPRAAIPWSLSMHHINVFVLNDMGIAKLLSVW